MNFHPVYIGLDPSLSHTGMVLLDHQNQIRGYKTIPTKPVKSWQEQSYREQSVMLLVQSTIEAWREKYGEPVIYIEDYAPNGRFIKTVIPTIELGGMLRLMLTRFPEVEFIPPTTLKKFTTGKGNAEKVDMATALAAEYGQAVIGFRGDDNLFDALALARLALAVAQNRFTLPSPKSAKRVSAR